MLHVKKWGNLQHCHDKNIFTYNYFDNTYGDEKNVVPLGSVSPNTVSCCLSSLFFSYFIILPFKLFSWIFLFFVLLWSHAVATTYFPALHMLLKEETFKACLRNFSQAQNRLKISLISEVPLWPAIIYCSVYYKNGGCKLHVSASHMKAVCTATQAALSNTDSINK